MLSRSRRARRIRFKHERPPIRGLDWSLADQGGHVRDQYIDRVDATNNYAIDFIDRDQNFARSTVNVDDPLLGTTYSDEDLRRRTSRCLGSPSIAGDSRCPVPPEGQPAHQEDWLVRERPDAFRLNLERYFALARTLFRGAERANRLGHCDYCRRP